VKRLDTFLIVAALLIAFVTIAAVIVRAGGHDQRVTSPAASPCSTSPAPQAVQTSAGVASSAGQ